jgi:hypothetical protein
VAAAFDEELFGRGYGEENDLACRMRPGYSTSCATRCSSITRRRLLAETDGGDLSGHLDRITQVWPDYHEVIRGFIERNPLWGAGPVRHRVAAPSKSSERRRVLT